MKKFAALFLAILMVASLAACSSAPAAGGTETAAPEATAAPAGTAAEAAAPAKDTLIIGQYGDTPNFDTHDNLNDNGMRINMVIYDPLVRMDNTTYEIHPCVAESWQISADGKEYTFKIKAGIKFNDGTDLTIDDVLFSLQRGMEMPMAVPSFARVTGVETVGADSVKITLDGPYPEFLFAMALPTAGIISKAAYETLGKDKFLEAPVTTGPYMVKEWKVGEKVVLEANPYYHEGEPAIKHVEWVVIADPNSAVLSLESGDIDAYVDVPQSSFSRIRDNKDLALYVGPAFGFSCVVINTTKAPFDNVVARQALAHAIDKDAILNGILDGNGTITDTFALPTYLGFTDKVTKYDYNLETAKAMFTQAGVTEGTEISIIVTNAQQSKVAQVVQNSLAEIGITANIQQLERSAYDDACLNGDANLMVDGFTYTAPTIDEAIYGGLHSSQIGICNHSLWNDPATDTLFEQARASTDNGERAAIYNELLIKLSQDLPIIPTIFTTKNIAAKAGLTGVSANPWSFYNLFDFGW